MQFRTRLDDEDHVADAKITPILKALAALDEVRNILPYPPFPD